MTSRAATLVFLNKGTAAMSVFPTNPRRIKLLCKYFITLGNKVNVSLLSHGRAAQECNRRVLCSDSDETLIFFFELKCLFSFENS